MDTPVIDLPLPASLIAVVTDRLAGLEFPARAALITVSALAYLTVPLTLRALDGVVADPGSALDAAVTVGIVEARTALEAALVCFTTLGAEPFARLAEADLARVRPARVGGALTKTESKIAELVATGLTNREVAAQLFASVRPVEGHLAAAYRKLGVRSRTELARLQSGQG